MSMREAIRAAVSSQPEFAGKSAAPADAEPTPDDVAEPGPKATDQPGSSAPADPGQDGGASALKTGPAGPAPTTPAQPGEQGHRDAAQAALPDAPARWPAAERAWFSSLPDEGKRLVLEREKRFNTAYTQVTQQLADTRKSHERLTGAFTPELRSQMSRAGLDERGALDYLVQYHQLYEANPVAYVQAAIQAKGLTPQQVFPDLASNAGVQPQPQAEDEWVDPQLLKATQRYDTQLNDMQRQLAALIQSQQQASSQQQQQMLNSLEEVVTDFAATTDASGNPAFPHIGEVFDQMLYLMNTNPTLRQIPPTRAREKLEQAYEMAVYLTPDLRERIIGETVEQRLAREKTANDADRARREQADAVERAKRASTVRPSPGADAPGARPGRTSIRDAARRAVSEHYR